MASEFGRSRLGFLFEVASFPAMSTLALDFLRTGVDSFAPFVQPSGQLHDPVFGTPTQYGIAYYALCNAVLAAHDKGSSYAEVAARGLDAALAHTEDPALPAWPSGFSRETGATSAGNHRDFTWPPILKTFLLLRELGALRPGVAQQLAERIAAVDIEASFRTRPPSNWSSVWLSGEWIRIREGLSPFGIAEFDAWLQVFFDTLIDVELGFYAEPGLPNSYDLFTRFHLADLLAEGYQGEHTGRLTQLLESGRKRSMGVQLSDGSLTAAHRSAGQTWTLGAQIAFLTLAEAPSAAALAFSSMRRFQRDGGPFSPVENVLPPSYRVGYEGYTADGHYSPLALAFLANAILHGFTGETSPPASRPASILIENEPTYRAVVHNGAYSAAVNAAPAPDYDAYGLTDLTFGPGRTLQFASSVRCLATGRYFNLGLDTEGVTRAGPLVPFGETGVGVTGTDSEGRSVVLSVLVSAVDGVTIEQTGPPVLFVPYLRDAGAGVVTTVSRTPAGLVLTHGPEQVVIEIDTPITAGVVLEHGFENRRGLCGLVRLDLVPAPSYTIRVFSGK